MRRFDGVEREKNCLVVPSVFVKRSTGRARRSLLVCSSLLFDVKTLLNFGKGKAANGKEDGEEETCLALMVVGVS